jgi:RNA methyltransferase, TrmH family
MTARAPERITSPANPLIKQLKGLHAKKGRSEAGLFLGEGLRLALEAAELGRLPHILLYTADALERPAARGLVRRLEQAGAKCIETTPTILSAVSKRDNAQTVVAAYPQVLATLPDLSRVRLLIALQGVRDPGNLGTILRTADAIGAGGVVLLDQVCDPFSVEAVRASMGSLFAVKLARTDFAAFNAWRQGQGLQMAGLSLKGRLGPEAYDAARPTVLLMGNEQSGLPEAHENACDALIKLPMRGRADSLNLAVATAVIAYDHWRRNGYDGAHD